MLCILSVFLSVYLSFFFFLRFFLSPLRSSIFSFGVEIGIGVSATYINGIQNQNILATVSRTIPLVRSHVRGGQETH
jgi:hypothetical protein